MQGDKDTNKENNKKNKEEKKNTKLTKFSEYLNTAIILISAISFLIMIACLESAAYIYEKITKKVVDLTGMLINK
jgi:hypothetical protein